MAKKNNESSDKQGSNNKRDQIVLNKLFSGGYLTDNIGHEFINLYQDDAGRNYVYIQPTGDFGKDRQNRIDKVLMVRGVEGMQTLEVLAMATISKDIYDPKDGNSEASRKKQRQYINEEKVSYCKKPLFDFFSKNPGLKDGLDQDVLISLQAEKVIRPAKKTFIVYCTDNCKKNNNSIQSPYCAHNCCCKERLAHPQRCNNSYECRKETLISWYKEAMVVCLPNVPQAKQSLKHYFKKGDNGYQELANLTKDSQLWFETNKTNMLDHDEINKIIDKGVNFFDICGIADYELAFSNALAYFIKRYPDLVDGFTKWKYGKTVNPFTTVERETGNIDILLENDEYLVVIENKITSKINGIQETENGKVGSQLLKYIQEAIVFQQNKQKKDSSNKFDG